jgi:hypothetical protein
MKLLTTTMNYSNEFDVNFFSLFSQNRYEILKNKIEYNKLLITNKKDFYFGENVCFNFNISDLIDILEKSIDISEEESEVLTKYKIPELKGNFDVFSRLEEYIDTLIKNKRY